MQTPQMQTQQRLQTVEIINSVTRRQAGIGCFSVGADGDGDSVWLLKEPLKLREEGVVFKPYQSSATTAREWHVEAMKQWHKDAIYVRARQRVEQELPSSIPPSVASANTSCAKEQIHLCGI